MDRHRAPRFCKRLQRSTSTTPTTTIALLPYLSSLVTILILA
ncbi:MAG TPA: hypothetical protein VGL94_10985 [Ktedonobacteraceae bacterium]